MTHFLFAGNKDFLKGGANDLVASYFHLDDQTVFVAIMDLVRGRQLQPAARIWANAFSCEGKALGERRHWEFRMAASMDDPALQFCSYKADLPGMGPCGVVPLARRVERVNAYDVGVFYPVLDESQTNVDLLP